MKYYWMVEIKNDHSYSDKIRKAKIVEVGALSVICRYKKHKFVIPHRYVKMYWKGVPIFAVSSERVLSSNIAEIIGDDGIMSYPFGKYSVPVEGESKYFLDNTLSSNLINNYAKTMSGGGINMKMVLIIGLLVVVAYIAYMVTRPQKTVEAPEPEGTQIITMVGNYE